MTEFEFIYTLSWLALTASALILLLSHRIDFIAANSAYWTQLLQKWKIITFLIATLGISAMGPFTRDPTWDFVTAPMMSILTFLTAPWAVGALYRVLFRKAPIYYVLVSGVAWMLSTSWLYDLYLFFRDGTYPVTWLANMAASSLIYLSAGLLWSLDWREERGITFSFMEQKWFHASNDSIFAKIWWIVLLFISLGAGMLLPYLFLQ
ncbi:MAG: hypothetical protein ACXVB4_14080 [Pseudobdellovibrionaceae bacterium]